MVYSSLSWSIHFFVWWIKQFSWLKLMLKSQYCYLIYSNYSCKSILNEYSSHHQNHHQSSPCARWTTCVWSLFQDPFHHAIPLVVNHLVVQLLIQKHPSLYYSMYYMDYMDLLYLEKKKWCHMYVVWLSLHPNGQCFVAVVSLPTVVSRICNCCDMLSLWWRISYTNSMHMRIV